MALRGLCGGDWTGRSGPLVRRSRRENKTRIPRAVEAVVVRVAEFLTEPDPKLGRVDGASAGGLTREKDELLDVREAEFRFDMLAKNGTELARGNATRPGERDVGMKRAKVRFEASAEDCVLHMFVESEQVRMASSHSRP